MIKEARGFGATISEAKENAIINLGANIDDDIQFETISTPKKKVLGIFGGCQAEVRAFVEMPDPKPKREKKPANNNKNNPRKAPEVKKAEPTAEKQPKAQKPVNEEKVVEAKNEPKEEAKIISSTVDDYKDAIDESEIPADSPTGKAIAYLRVILEKLGCEGITVKAAVKESGAFIILDGEGLGVIIGHRGETLDSLQYLTSLAANNGGGYFKISLNIGNYREKREKTLASLANRVSQQVIRTGRSRSLEPMNPYERRIIHTVVQDIEGVTSNSIGEGSHRRVVIYPEGNTERPRRNNGKGHGHERERKSSNSITAPTREPKKDSDMPLYGKIN